MRVKLKGMLGRQWTSRALVIMALDVLLVAGSYFVALLLRFDLRWSQVPAEYMRGYLMLLPWTLALVVGLFWVLRLYHSVWTFASFPELIRLLESWLAASVALLLLAAVLGVRMPVSYWLMGDVLAFGLTTAMRFSYRLARIVRQSASRKSAKRALIVGAGESGRALIREIGVSPQLDLEVVAAVDDNPAKHGRYIEGIPIVGGRSQIASACDEYGVDQIVYAIPSCSGRDRREILELCHSTGREVRVLPGTYQLIEGDVTVSDLREVRIEDLLGRDPVMVSPSDIGGLVRGRRVLVTGGGGSIGSELCRQVARHNPQTLVIFDIYENNAYAIQQELMREHPGLDLRVLIGSVRDTERVREVFYAERPQVVFHAAAHKHVPLMEVSPREAVKNNVFGTINCARAASESGAERFVLISTDKAVNPTNVMGATKRLCEMAVQAEERRARRDGAPTTYSAVRFGNVLGSNGSVVPLFRQQIAEGGPVTVTHPDITRFFMTIPEAVSLVLQSGCYAAGGEIFVLDMGEPVRIDDMARKLIRLSGHVPDGDIKVVYTGLRPGEKLYEERLMAEEGLGPTPNSLIHVAEPIEMDDEAFAGQLEALWTACGKDDAEIRVALAAAVPTYHPELGGMATGEGN